MSSTTKCKACGIEKTRIKDLSGNGRKKVYGFKYRDETGRPWHGLLCPQCHGQKTYSIFKAKQSLSEKI